MNSLKKTLSTVKKFLVKYIDYNSLFWRSQNLKSISYYWNSRDGLREKFIITSLKHIEFDSLLEIGCNCGNQIYNITTTFPDKKITGIDINAHAIQWGKQKFLDENLTNVTLLTKRAENLQDFCDNEFDLIASFATLMYIHPRKIKSILKEMMRIAKHSLILMEQQGRDPTLDPSGTGIFYSPSNWKRDYIRLFKELGINEQNISCDPIPPDVWMPGGGGASMLTITLNANS